MSDLLQEIKLRQLNNQYLIQKADRRLITDTAETLWQDIHTVAWL